jgi:hypothetical protein
MKNPQTAQVVELMQEFKTPRCKRGGRFSKYMVHTVNKVNCTAVNLGTFAVHTLRISELKATNLI